MTTRTLLTREPLPEYPTSAMRIAAKAHDVREATARLKARLEAHATQYTATGWTLDDESWQAGALEYPNGRILAELSVKLHRE